MLHGQQNIKNIFSLVHVTAGCVYTDCCVVNGNRFVFRVCCVTRGLVVLADRDVTGLTRDANLALLDSV